MTWFTLKPTKQDFERAKHTIAAPLDLQRPEYWLRAQHFRAASIFSWSYDPSGHQTLLIVAGLTYCVLGDHSNKLMELFGDEE